MLSTNNTDRQKSQNQNQLSISNWAAHNKDYPYLTEFSDLISKLSIDRLLELMTYQQKMFANSLWEAENYGGSEAKCEKRLEELYGPKWYEITSIEDNMANKREYYELVLRMNHRKQWDDQRFWGNISEDKDIE